MNTKINEDKHMRQVAIIILILIGFIVTTYIHREPTIVSTALFSVYILSIASGTLILAELYLFKHKINAISKYLLYIFYTGLISCFLSVILKEFDILVSNFFEIPAYVSSGIILIRIFTYNKIQLVNCNLNSTLAKTLKSLFYATILIGYFGVFSGKDLSSIIGESNVLLLFEMSVIFATITWGIDELIFHNFIRKLDIKTYYILSLIIIMAGSILILL
ncbi:MAG: hypothetical protein KJ709_08180 [Nanoarchaeota archaeon]|nr:hypothetical protein [Nanoarchaeota archaeon]